MLSSYSSEVYNLKNVGIFFRFIIGLSAREQFSKILSFSKLLIEICVYVYHLSCNTFCLNFTWDTSSDYHERQKLTGLLKETGYLKNISRRSRKIDAKIKISKFFSLFAILTHKWLFSHTNFKWENLH